MTIVVTAVVTAIAKELTVLVISKLKSTHISPVVTAILKRITNVYLWSIAFDFIGIAVVSGLSIWLFNSDAPATRNDLFNLFVLCFGLVYFTASLIFDYFRFKISSLTKRDDK